MGKVEGMNTYVHLDEATEDRIYQLRKEGLDRSALSTRFGISEDRVTRILVKVKTRKGGKRDV